MTTTTKTLDPTVMANFTGSETFYRHPLMRKVVYTEGVHYVAETAGAYWFLDKIATMQMDATVGGEEFQVWKLEVADGKGVINVEDGNGGEVYSEAITFTDFPEPGITLWFTDNTILLPSEY
jgi:hypothetical protein